MNRTETMLKVLEEADGPMELEHFLEACAKMNPQDRGSKSYRRNMWQIRDRVTKYEQGKNTFIKMKEFDLDEQKHTVDITPEAKSSHVTNAIESTAKPNGTVPFVDPDPANYIARNPGGDYVEINNEWKLVNAHLGVAHSKPLLLEGPKGIAKTYMIQLACFRKGIHLRQFDCSDNMKRYDLVGRFVLAGKELAKYVLGAMAATIQIANKTGHCVLVLEELNALSHNIQIALNQLTDFRKQVYIPELDVTFRVAEGNRLSVFGTQNPSDYLGVNELNEAVRSRFREKKLFYPTEAQEQKIVATKGTSLSDDDIAKICRLAKLSRDGVTSGDYSYALSPRDVCEFAEIYDMYRLDEAMAAVEGLAWKEAVDVSFIGRYDQRDERESFIKIAERTLGFTYKDQVASA